MSAYGGGVHRPLGDDARRYWDEELRGHNCKIVARWAGYRATEPAEFLALCDICGPVGRPQASHTDAAGVAGRHLADETATEEKH